MSKQIFVEVTLPRNYQVNLSGGKPAYPKMVIFGWYEEKQEDWGTCLSGLHGKNGWMEMVTVEDSVEGQCLPDEMYVIASTNGSSWYASRAFISRESADKATTLGQSSSWASWAVLVKRGKNEKDPRDLCAFQF